MKENKRKNKTSKLLTENSGIGLEQLRAKREETIQRWSKAGLLEGLTDGVQENLATMFECEKPQIIHDNDDSYCSDFKPDNQVFTRASVITIIKRYAFHLSDNGDPDESAKDWFDRMYPIILK